MPTYPFAQIDAFASKPFEGNQACVMPLDGGFLDDATLQSIAAENNVAETAFLVADGPGRWQLRWFTPAVEVPLCGHATLAAAHYLYQHGGFTGEQITLATRLSGELFVSQLPDGRLEMDFPSFAFENAEIDAEIVATLGGGQPVRAMVGPCVAYQFESAADIHALSVDHKALAGLGDAGLAWGTGNFGCFALDGDGVDITSRFFAPGSGIDEDPATGSWHAYLASLTGKKFGRAIKCFQAYPGRGAQVEAELVGERVKLRGRAVTVIEGQFRL